MIVQLFDRSTAIFSETKASLKSRIFFISLSRQFLCQLRCSLITQNKMYADVRKFANDIRGRARTKVVLNSRLNVPYVSTSPHTSSTFGPSNGVNSLSLIRASLNRAHGCRSLLLSHAENLHLTTGLHDRR